MKTKTPTHSKIGASSCERWWNCPGSVALIDTLPPQPTSEYATEGTAAHKLAEICLTKGLIAEQMVGQTIPAENGTVRVVTEEMAEAVQVYLDVIRTDMKKYKVHPSDLSIEHRFHLVHIDKDAYGTNDASLKVAFTKVIVYDYKHGAGVAVDAEDNKQGLFYAEGAAHGEEIDEVEIVIVQPRAIHKDGPIRRWTVSKGNLADFAVLLKAKAAATKDPNAPRRCGDWCRKTFCGALSFCPEVRQQVEKAATVAFQQAGIEAKLPQPEALSPLQLRHLLQTIPLLDAWARSVTAYAENQMNNGQEVLGFKLVRGREGHRKWIDEAQVEKHFGEHCHEVAVMSPTALEKKLGKKEFTRLAASFVTRSEGKIIMVPEDDPRESVNPNLIEVFKEEELT